MLAGMYTFEFRAPKISLTKFNILSSYPKLLRVRINFRKIIVLSLFVSSNQSKYYFIPKVSLYFNIFFCIFVILLKKKLLFFTKYLFLFLFLMSYYGKRFEKNWFYQSCNSRNSKLQIVICHYICIKQIIKQELFCAIVYVVLRLLKTH